MFTSQLHVWWSQHLQERIRWESRLLLILGVWGGPAQVSRQYAVCCKERSVRKGEVSCSGSALTFFELFRTYIYKHWKVLDLFSQRTSEVDLGPDISTASYHFLNQASWRLKSRRTNSCRGNGTNSVETCKRSIHIFSYLYFQRHKHFDLKGRNQLLWLWSLLDLW